MAESDQCPLIRISLDMGNFKLVLNVASLQGERHRFAAPMVPFGENLCLLFTIVRFVLSRQFIKLRIDNFQALLCLNMIKNPALREKTLQHIATAFLLVFLGRYLYANLIVTLATIHVIPIPLHHLFPPFQIQRMVIRPTNRVLVHVRKLGLNPRSIKSFLM